MNMFESYHYGSTRVVVRVVVADMVPVVVIVVLDMDHIVENAVGMDPFLVYHMKADNI